MRESEHFVIDRRPWLENPDLGQPVAHSSRLRTGCEAEVLFDLSSDILNVASFQIFRPQHSGIVDNPVYTAYATRLDSFVAFGGVNRRLVS